MSKWISVEDKLPEIQKGMKALSADVLFYSKQGEFIGYYNHNKGIWSCDNSNTCTLIGGVTHWMPMPDPPTL